MRRPRVRNAKLRLRLAGVMSLDAFREQALAAALSQACKYRATVRFREWLACEATSAAFQEI
jgi:hypothetical protein